MNCPRCGHENLEGELFCGACQQRLPRPSAAVYDEMYRAQDASWQSRRRQDIVHALVWGVGLGFGTLALALMMEAGGGDPSLIALGKQIWWLVGILWGLGAWGLRRVSAPGR